MSKASEWAKRILEDPPPGVEFDGVTASVHNSGRSAVMRLECEDPDRDDSEGGIGTAYLAAKDAVTLAHWILDTFGESRPSGAASQDGEGDNNG